MMYNECSDIIENYPYDNMIFWVGAGIDADYPTSLPLGAGLTTHFLNLACGEEIGSKIMDFWSEREEKLKTVDNNIEINKFPRLETVLEAIRQFENSLNGENTPHIISGLQSFRDAPQNNIHYILAYLISKGANVVTTNYDNCIAKAYNELCGSSKMIQIGKDGIYIDQCNNDKCGKIYHLHGVSDDINNIGATLSVVKNPIGKMFDIKMTEWVRNGKLFIFLGYGGVDSLDITPYLESKKSVSKSVALYVRHASKNNCNFVKLMGTEEKLMSGFLNQFTVNYNTNDFMVDFFGINYNGLTNKMQKYNWKENFSKYIVKYTEKHQKMCSWSVIDYLDCTPKYILGTGWKDIQNKNLDNTLDIWYIGNYGFRNCLRDGDSDSAYKFSDLLAKSDLLRSDVMASKSAAFSFLFAWLDINKYLKQANIKIRNKEIIDWKISTPINRAIYFVLCFIALSPMNVKICMRFVESKSRRILYTVEKMLESGSSYFLDIRQMYVGYINSSFLELLFNQNYDKAINYIYKARYNYSEISNISGIINSFLFEIVYYEFLYFNNVNQIYKTNIKKTIDKVRQIIKIEGYENKYNSFIYIIEKLDNKINNNKGIL